MSHAADGKAPDPAAEAETDGFAGRSGGGQENGGDDQSPGGRLGFDEQAAREHEKQLGPEKIKKAESRSQNGSQSADGDPGADAGVKLE